MTRFKQTVRYLILFGMSLLLGACSNRQVYEGIQDNRSAACNREPNESARAECLGELKTDYPTYQRQRDALLRDQN